MFVSFASINICYKYKYDFMLRRNVKHYEIQTIATAMDAYASLDSDITGATLYF